LNGLAPRAAETAIWFRFGIRFRVMLGPIVIRLMPDADLNVVAIGDKVLIYIPKYADNCGQNGNAETNNKRNQINR
jgi:hypothetical protein